jgi:hypothetical protein
MEIRRVAHTLGIFKRILTIIESAINFFVFFFDDLLSDGTSFKFPLPKTPTALEDFFQ